ncbi:hypothetical protein BN2476_1290023 [Paraburkholderia piptadeniae]|uniref:Uncharacterized protein n=1 Tax=Paraburkholderia piptadeniae TaxID=1701573 RepID=A0A1N7SWF7_9BURK|nr:hypothetical protein BN2476_1290023 [Paraburkholderia piptadeniae]
MSAGCAQEATIMLEPQAGRYIEGERPVPGLHRHLKQRRM